MGRIGFGYDLHPLEAGRRFILGGVTIPFAKGAAGHSDADVVVHALIDALLGASALGNIGEHFPDDDPQYKNINSLLLLEKTIEHIEAAGYRLVNMDAVIVLEAPRLAPYLESMRAKLSETLRIDACRISIKPKTNEGMGPEGRGEAVSACVAVLMEELEKEL